MKLQDITWRLDLPLFLVKNNLTKIGAEVGVKYGGFSAYILENWPGVLYSIDKWRHDTDYETAIKTLNKYDNRSIIKRQHSNVAVKEFDDNSLDFCYIDAGHNYKAIKEDISIWYPKVKPGGLFCGDDYCHDEQVWRERGHTGKIHTGVKQAVDEFINTYKLQLHNESSLPPISKQDRGPRGRGCPRPVRWPSTWYVIKPLK